MGIGGNCQQLEGIVSEDEPPDPSPVSWEDLFSERTDAGEKLEHRLESDVGCGEATNVVYEAGVSYGASYFAHYYTSADAEGDSSGFAYDVVLSQHQECYAQSQAMVLADDNFYVDDRKLRYQRAVQDTDPVSWYLMNEPTFRVTLN